MSIYVLKEYVENCKDAGEEPSFEGLKIYYKVKKYLEKNINTTI